jgi:putative ABC transport system ATP-binding protein
MTDVVLSAANLSKVFRAGRANETRALDGLTLEVGNGECVALMGPSGSGKTTFLSLVCGLDRSTSGELRVANEEVSRLASRDLAPFRLRHLGLVPQDFCLIDSLTALENVMLPLVLAKRPSAECESRAAGLLSLLGLGGLEHRRPYELSGGECQRVAVARAIANEPELICADEPTGNLDSRSAEAVLGCLSALRGKGRAVLLVTHDPWAASIADRVVLLRDGRCGGEARRREPRSSFLADIQAAVGSLR